MWTHMDQGFDDTSFKCVQGFVTLFDVNDGDATLFVHEGSNKGFPEFKEKFKSDIENACIQMVYGGKTTSIKMSEQAPYNIEHKLGTWHSIETDEQMKWMFKNYPPSCVKATAGSLFLFDSRTCHQGIQPHKTRASTENNRGIVYLCYMPRKPFTKQELAKKVEYFEKQITTNHWPAGIHFKEFPPPNSRSMGNHPVLNKPGEPVNLGLLYYLAGFPLEHCQKEKDDKESQQIDLNQSDDLSENDPNMGQNGKSEEKDQYENSSDEF